MRNKPWKNTQTAIELTSLLDVIFIVLMIVVCNQQISTKNQVEQAEAAIAEAEVREQAAGLREQNLTELEAKAEAALAEAEAMQAAEADVAAERDFYKEQLDTYENLASEILAVTVYVDYDPADLKSRSIRILSGTAEQEAVSLTPETAENAWAETERRLGEILFENKDIPVIMTVSNTAILYRDEKKLTEILEKLGESHSNLYIK